MQNKTHTSLILLFLKNSIENIISLIQCIGKIQFLCNSLKTLLCSVIFFMSLNVIADEKVQNGITLKNESDLLLVGKQTYFLEDKNGNLTIKWSNWI